MTTASGSNPPAPVVGAGARSVGHTDMRPGWIDRFVPAPARPYLRLMRLDRPIGIWLRLFPAWWAILLANQGRPHLGLLALFLAEAILTRSLGCIINDILDRHIDAQVERTRMRPLASNQLTVRQAIAFLALLAVLEFLVLSSLGPLLLSMLTATLVLAALYPLMKRLTWWPQAFLGVVYNSGALMGWVALSGKFDLAPLLLYAGCVLWTLGYDTIYAHQDKRDDARIGVKSTAVYLGRSSRGWVSAFYALALLFWGAALASQLSPSATLAALLAVTLHFVWQLRSWNPESPADCLAKFKSNQSVGWLLLAGLALVGGGFR
ncbi:4-hydroxybenzoate octaprenyltransferase [Archangium violaceum]|nr:4-hydroxybenzoate octaprenyltransferase [Archangium violaceum]